MLHVSRRQFLGSAALLAVAASAGRAWQPETRPSLEKRRLGNTDMDVTILGFGGAEIGFQDVEQATIEKLLNSALDAGLNVIDTAECYRDSEESIGNAIGHRRKDYYLFTKVGHAFGRGADGWTADSIAKSIDRSLELLKCEHVDLVQLHSCDRATLEKGECIQALEKAKKAGKARYIGYSGDSDAALYAVKSGRFDTLQTSVSFADQEVIDLVLPTAREKNIGVIAKRPIANAVWRSEKEPSGGSREYWRRMQKLGYDFTKGAAREDASPEGAAGHALRFTCFTPGVHVAIVGTTKPERWKQNADLLRGGALPKDKYDAIRARWKEAAEPGWKGQT